MTEEEEIQQLKEKCEIKLKLLNETIWEKKATTKKINNWLKNFSEEEQIQALYLLTQFIYFNEFQIKTLFKSLYRDLFMYEEIKLIRMNNNDTLDEDLINTEYIKVLKKTRFVVLGNPAESSSELMAVFRKQNDLALELFKNEDTVNACHKSINHFVFIDDLCGSGTQAKRYSNNIIPKIRKTHPHAKFSYLMLVGTKEGKSKIMRETEFDYTASVLELDSSYKCFSNNSRAFINKNKQISIEKTKELCSNHGKTLMKHFYETNHPQMSAEKVEQLSERNKLGFGDGQLLIGFHHNTPNNSLPIFWYNEDEALWVPIFKRINKKYKI